MAVSRRQHVLILVATTALLLLFTVGLVYMVVRGGRTRQAAGRPAEEAQAIPDARLRNLLADSETRLDAAVQAGKRKLAVTLPLLKRYAAEDKDPQVREACVRSLGQIGSIDAALVLVTATGDGDRRVRLAAIEALGRVPDPACCRELVRQTRAEDAQIRRAAVIAVGAFAAEEASAALDATLDDPDDQVRLAAVQMLSRRQDTAARRGLVKAVEDVWADVRQVAATSLVEQAQPDDWPALCRAMLDDEESVRAPTLEFAGQVGEPIVKQMEKALRDAAADRRTKPVSIAARNDVARLLMQLGGDGVVGPLILCLDGADHAPAAASEQLRSAVVKHLQERGEAVLGPLSEAGIEARVGFFAKEAVARVCRHVGRPAAVPIQEYILRYRLFPHVTELKLWVETLGELGDPQSAAALNRALAQDVPEINDLVIAARAKIEAVSGTKLPPARPDLGRIESEEAFEIRRGLPPGGSALPEITPGEFPENAMAFLTLTDALVRPEDMAMRKPLELELSRRDGKWDASVSGTARKYNQAFHTGTLEEMGDGGVRVELLVGDDPWVTGGFGQYEIDLRLGDDGLSGSYSGRYNYRDVSGRVTGRLLPLLPPSQNEAPPLESGEHPRLVFRRGEIPAMRRRAQTDIGRAIVRAIRDRVADRSDTGHGGLGLDGAVGCGFLYALYGDEPMGRRAVPALIEAARRTGFAHLHQRAYDLNSASIAYDFVYDCLTAGERDELTDYLAKMHGILVPSVGLTGNFNNGPNSNWTAIGLGGTGLASLATLGEKGPIGVHEPPEVKPAFELVAEKGANNGDVPVNQYEPGQVLKHWLMAGPFQSGPGVDLVAALGGAEHARPKAGAPVEVDGHSVTFAPLPGGAVRKTAGMGRKPHKLVLPAAADDSRSLLYGLLRVDEQSGAKIDLTFPYGFKAATLWIDGREIPSGSSLLLQPGLYRLLVEVEGPVVCPMLYEANVHQQMGLYQRYLRRQQAYRSARKRHAETGHRQDVPLKLDLSTRAMVAWWRLSIGDHGWGTESGYAHAHGNLMPFTAAYETATGRRVIPGTGIPWMNPLVLAATTASGRPRLSSLKEVPLGMTIHVVDPEVRPALLERLQPERFAETARRMSCKELAFLFVNYPLDARPRPAEEVMPKVIADRAKGGYLFRSSYDRGEDDILAAIFLRSDPNDGPCYFYQESGTFRLVGLGTQWAIGLPGDKRNWQYAQENVVLVPPSNGRGLGKEIYFEPQSDGSGAVGAEMSDVYRDGDLPIRATRHFAVDFSGKSGAPALLAVVDQLDGGAEKTWVMHSGGKATSVSSGEFSMTGQLPDTSLHGRLVGSDGVRLATGPVVWNQHNREFDKQQKAPAARGSKDVTIKRDEIPERIDHPWGSQTTLRAIADTEQTVFFFVMTLQRGDPPEIEVSGRGLDAQVTVGDRVVKFVGGRLRIE